MDPSVYPTDTCYNYLPPSRAIGAHLGVLTFGNPISKTEFLEALRWNASQAITSRNPRAPIRPSDDSSYIIDDAEDDGYPSRGRPIGASTRRVIITILQ